MSEARRPSVEKGIDNTSGRSLDRPGLHDNHAQSSPSDLKRQTARGALTSVIGQGANFVLRFGSMIIIARLVRPEHFGLVGMVTAFTGLLSVLRDGGLSQAMVQRPSVSEALTSTLFWFNLAIGIALAAITAVAAPLLAFFYGDSRLLGITIVLGAGFALNGASAQHRALLQRSMRFGSLVAIDIAALLVSICVGVGMAMAGWGYWALVGMTVALPTIAMIGAWIATGWVPGRPRKGVGVRSMLRYGGMITVNSAVIYAAYNVDKVLLGRFWGAEVLGLYGRAYQLISIPTENLHSAMSYVMFPTLARVQDDPQRLRSYFLKAYGLFLSVVLPITIACGLFAADIVRVFLGPQWSEAVPVFQLLAPTILAFALINPMGYMMQATGRAFRSLKTAFVIAPVVVAGYVLGLPHGPTGVALGFSLAMLMLVVPIVQWAKHGTLITTADLLRTAVPPVVSTLAGAAMAVLAGMALAEAGALLRLVLASAILFGIHGVILLLGFGQKTMYLNIARAIGLPLGRWGTKVDKPRADL